MDRPSARLGWLMNVRVIVFRGAICPATRRPRRWIRADIAHLLVGWLALCGAEEPFPIGRTNFPFGSAIAVNVATNGKIRSGIRTSGINCLTRYARPPKLPIHFADSFHFGRQGVSIMADRLVDAHIRERIAPVLVATILVRPPQAHFAIATFTRRNVEHHALFLAFTA
jgi:hypothetical protein